MRISYVRRKFTITLLSSLVGSITPFALAADPLSGQKIEQIEKVVTAFMSKGGIPGASVAIGLNGETIWSNGYGLADTENFVPAKATTVYRSGSIGKTITATGAMQLVEQEKLNLDSPIQDYCPAFPKKQWKLTTRQLLAHMGGVRHYGGPHDKEEQASTIHYAGVTEALAPFKDDPLLFEPGTKFSYSTYGYGVVGCVVEGAAHIPFMEYLRRAIFEPAGMSHTRQDEPREIIENRAAGYVRVDGKLQKAPFVDMSNRLPAGGYVTTVGGLTAFMNALVNGKLIKPSTLSEMQTPQKLPNGAVSYYGLGWGLFDDGPDDAAHGGSTPGFSGMIYMNRRNRISVAILTNLEDAPERSETAFRIARAALGPESTPQPAASKNN